MLSVRLEVKALFEQFDSKVDSYYKINKDSYIYDYFSDIRNEIDLYREELIKKINDESEELIKKLKEKEENCKNNAKNVVQKQLDEIQGFQNIPKLKATFLNKLSITDIELIEIMTKLNQVISEISDLSNKLKNELILDESIKFEKGDPFGTLVESKACLNLAKNCGDLIKKYQKHTSFIRSIKVDLESNRLVTSSDDKTINIWNLISGECIKTLYGHKQWVTTVLLTENNQLISSSADKTLKIWDYITFECLKTIDINLGVHSLCLISSDKLACGCFDGSIKVCNLNYLNSQDIESVKDKHKDVVTNLILTKDSTKMISCSARDNEIIIWAVNDFTIIKKLDSHSNGVSCIYLTNEGNLVSGSYRTTKIWNINDGECLDTITFDYSKYTSFTIYSILQISHDVFVIGFNNIQNQNKENLILYDIKMKKILFSFQANLRAVTNCALLSNGNLLTTSESGEINQWEFLNSTN